MPDDFLMIAALSVTLIVGVVVVALPLPDGLRAPLVVFNAFYILTSVIGASLLANGSVFALWTIAFPSMDARWVYPGGSALYWIIVIGPLIVTNAAAYGFASRFGDSIAARASAFRMDPGWLACALAGFALVAYCVFNLYVNGYLSAGRVSADSLGAYQANIRLRTEMAATLGDMHYGFIYMAIPAICVIALQKAAGTRRLAWWFLFLSLGTALSLLYLSTLTKSNLLVFGVALAIAAFMERLVGKVGLLVAGVAGLGALAIQTAWLSGSSPLELIGTLTNLVFRVSSGIPFYLAIFPEQHPFVGVDFGLGWFGIGPSAAPNLLVADRMFPADTWVQGAIPAPAHVVAYAQAGVWFSLVTMVLVGAYIAAASGLGRRHRSVVIRSAYIGACIGCYNATQTDAVGVVLHSYGLKWWLFGLMAVCASQLFLESVERGFSRTFRSSN